MNRVGKHAEAEAGGKSDGFAQWRFWGIGLADRLIEDRWKRACRHVFSPCSTADSLQYRGARQLCYSLRVLHAGNLVRSRSLGTLIVVNLCQMVFALLYRWLTQADVAALGLRQGAQQSDWQVEPELREIKLLTRNESRSRALFSETWSYLHNCL